MEYKTLDSSKKFELSLINPDQDTSRDNGRYQSIQGNIDGNNFSIRVPRHIIQDGSGSVSLRVKNLKTGDIQSVPAAFIDDMRSTTEHPHISIDSKDVQNYQQKIVPQVTPPIPGQGFDY